MNHQGDETIFSPQKDSSHDLNKMFFSYEVQIKTLEEIKDDIPQEVWPFIDELTHEIRLSFHFCFPHENIIKDISFTSLSKYHPDKALKQGDFKVRINSYAPSDDTLFFLNGDNLEHRKNINSLARKNNPLLKILVDKNTQFYSLLDFSFMDILEHTRNSIIDNAFNDDIKKSLSLIKDYHIQEFHGLLEDSLGKFFSSVQQQVSVDTLIIPSKVITEIIEALQQIDAKHRSYRLHQILKNKNDSKKPKI